MSVLNNKKYLDGDGLIKFWEICCANFPAKDGRGAKGTWPISITGNASGNAATATKLQTARTIWGQSFDGTANVTGNMTGVGSLSMVGPLTITGTTAETTAIKFSRSGNATWNYIIWPGNSSDSCKLAFGYDTNDAGSFYYMTSNAFYPRAADTYSLGTSSLKWSNVYATTFTGNLTGIASKVTVGTGSGSTYRAIVVTDGSNGLYTAGTAAGKPQYNYSTGDVKAKSFTTDGGNFIGNLNGNATSADKLNTNAGSATKPVYFGDGIPKQCNDTLAVSITGNAATATTADTAAKTAKTLTLKTPAETKTFNGSADVTFEVTPAKLGLTKAVLYLGKSTTAITDGGTEKPTIDGSVVNTLTAGNIVIDSADEREYIWNGSKWEKFGLDGDAASGNYKPIQQTVGDPAASGNSTTFIDTISQDANGKITVTKKNVNFAGYKTTQTAVSSPSASGNTTAFIDTISQNTNGVITVTKKNVDFSSYVPKSGDTTISGTLTANGFVGNLVGSATTATKATQDSDGNAINTTYLKRSQYGYYIDSYTFDNGPTDLGWVYLGSFTGSNTGLKIECDYASHCSNDYGTCTSQLILGVRPYSLDGFISKIKGSGGGLYITEGPQGTNGYYDYNVYIYVKAWMQGQVRIQTLGNNSFTWAKTSTAPNSAHTVRFDARDLDGYYVCHKTNVTKASLEGHTHNFADLSNHMVATNEFNFVPNGYNSDVYFNYRAVGGTGTVNAYRFTNGAGRGGYAPCYATNFITTSDRRMKENITEIVDASKSLELGFYEFDYKTGGHSAGHIAQDVREVYPAFVHGEETEKDNLSVDYNGLHTMQIKALKDKVTTLENENNDLKNRIEKLEALIEKLM